MSHSKKGIKHCFSKCNKHAKHNKHEHKCQSKNMCSRHKHKCRCRRECANENVLTLLFSVYVKEAQVTALDQQDVRIVIKDSDVIKIHAFSNRPERIQFTLPNLQALLNFQGLLDVNNPPNLIANFERNGKLQDITLELLSGTYDSQKKETTLNARRIPGAQTFEQIELPIGQSVTVTDLRLFIDDVIFSNRL